MVDAVKDLIERLEAAAEGSRELDARIWQLVDPKAASAAAYDGRAFSNRDWTEEEKARKSAARVQQIAPHYTTSIDAALTLVPENWRLGEVTRDVDFDGPEKSYGVSIERLDAVGNYAGNEAAAHDIFALALCIASLRARQP